MRDSSRVDAVVVGATPGGIATAVRAAREGVETQLVSKSRHLGGPLPSLGGVETAFDGRRAPLIDTFTDRIRDHYRETYGADSPQYETCARVENHVSFEPHVAETILEDLVDLPGLEVLRGYRLTTVERRGDRIESVVVKSVNGGTLRRLPTDAVVDATYEGDVAAAAGVPCRVGREGRDEYGEQHAGRLFLAPRGEAGERDVSDDLALTSWTVAPRGIMAGSTGVGDAAVQAYQYRLCLSDDPENRRMPEEPPEYDRETYLGLVDDDAPFPADLYQLDLDAYLPIDSGSKALPNDKVAFGYNTTNVLGGSHDYPDGDPGRRADIERRHLNRALGILYFLRTDEAVPDELQMEACKWGLACDEFADNRNRPHHLYVREARRIEGRTTITENDARLAEGIDRAPVRYDSVAMAGDWFMDSHGCTTRRQSGAIDGAHMLDTLTRPFHVPYRALVPRTVENLLVPVALSATHIAFGAIRLEPVWMHVGEAAGVALSVASDRDVAPGELGIDPLQRALAERGVMLAFFNDVDVGDDEPWVSAVQYFGTKGFFRTYDARPEAPLDEATADAWATTVAHLLAETLDPTKRARALRPVADETNHVLPTAFADRLATASNRVDADLDVEGVLDSTEISDGTLSRGDACQLAYETLAHG